MNIIYGIKAGNRLDVLKKDILELAENQIVKNAQGIIAGCTEIPLILKNGEINIPIIDPTLVLAQKAIERAKK
jgi:aspartate racemase